MAFRRVVAVTAAACGLAGGSVLLSSVAIGKQQQKQQQLLGRAGGGGDAPEPAAASLPAAAAPPPGLLLLPSPAASCPAAPGWLERSSNGCGYWDSNWDRWGFVRRRRLTRALRTRVSARGACARAGGSLGCARLGVLKEGRRWRGSILHARW